MLEVGGEGLGVEAAEREIVGPLAEGGSELQQTGEDAAPVLSAGPPLPDHLPRVTREYPMVVEGCYEVISLRAGVLPGGRHIGENPVQVGHKSIPWASISVAQLG